MPLQWGANGPLMEGSLSSWPVPQLVAQEQGLAAVPTGGGALSPAVSRGSWASARSLPPKASRAAEPDPAQAPGEPTHGTWAFTPATGQCP